MYYGCMVSEITGKAATLSADDSSNQWQLMKCSLYALSSYKEGIVL